MAIFFTPKRLKTTRTTKVGANPLTARIQSAFQNRLFVASIGLSLLSILVMLVAVESWKTVFPYRLNDRSLQGIAAKIDFEKLNQFETETARKKVESNVKYVFRQKKFPLKAIVSQFGSDLDNVTRSKTLFQVADEVKTALGWNDDSSGNNKEKPEEKFQKLKKTLASYKKNGITDADVMNEFESELQQLVAQFAQHGRASKKELSDLKLAAGEMVSILSEEDESRTTDVLPQDILLGEALKETNSLGSQLMQKTHLKSMQRELKSWLLAQLPVTLTYDRAKTETNRLEAVKSVKPVFDRYVKGQILVKPGEVIDADRLEVLKAEYDAYEESNSTNQKIGRTLTNFLMLSILGVILGFYIVRYQPQLVESLPRLASFLAGFVLAVFLGKFLSADPWRAEIIPLLTVTMVFAIVFNQQLAMICAIAVTIIVALSTGINLPTCVVMMGVTAAAIIPLSRVASRSTIIKVGFFSGAVYFAMTCGMGIIEGQTFGQVWTSPIYLLNALRGTGWCLVSGYLVAGSLPFVESTFDVVTDISLLEMSDVSHPLLQELVKQAPGTYNHSMAVATIGETAADTIGANGLLVRVGAYYHDVGKMLKPQYFIENISEHSESRHGNLNPAMSTLIIIGHVKDGADLAKKHNLPPQLIDFIEQHHGTTLVEYFYHVATKQADQNPDHKTDAEESSFRYPGPKPQTREACVMMLADAVESASRTLSEPTPKRIENLVEEITMKRLLDNQFEECDITLSEIRLVEQSLTKSLIGIYHGRIKYPEQRTA